MSDIATELELTLVEVFKASGWVKKVATFETSIRECLFSGDKFIQGFRAEELPAVAVSMQLKPTPSSQWTPCEEELRIPVSVSVVTRAMKRKDALAAAAELVDGVKYEVRQLRRSGNALGPNAVVLGEIASSATTIDEKPYSFAIATVEFTISKVVEV